MADQAGDRHRAFGAGGNTDTLARLATQRLSSKFAVRSSNERLLGLRRKFSVMGPSTNTIVQPDLEMMRSAGVTNHYSRILRRMRKR